MCDVTTYVTPTMSSLIVDLVLDDPTHIFTHDKGHDMDIARDREQHIGRNN
jgi:hypothetical protein